VRPAVADSLLSKQPKKKKKNRLFADAQVGFLNWSYVNRWTCLLTLCSIKQTRRNDFFFIFIYFFNPFVLLFFGRNVD